MGRYDSPRVLLPLLLLVVVVSSGVLVVGGGAAEGSAARGGGGGGAENYYSKLSGIIIPGFASTQLRAWSVLDCPYSPFDFNPLDSVWLDTTKVTLLYPLYLSLSLALSISIRDPGGENLLLWPFLDAYRILLHFSE